MRTRTAAAVLRRTAVAIGLLGLGAACSGIDTDGAVRRATGDDELTTAQAACIEERLARDYQVVVDELDEELSAEQTQNIAIARDICLLEPADAGDGESEEIDTSGVPAALADAPDRFDPDDRPPGLDDGLDALWLACGAGEAQACDELLIVSTPGSDYEAFAFSCGGRLNLRCSSLLGETVVPEALTPDSPAPGEDSVLDPWWERCAAGSAQACDQLLLTAPGNSDYYQFGLTCGGRATTYCRQLLGDDGTPPILEEIRAEDPPPGDDALLDQLWAACGLRNPQACDDLYAFAPRGSIYERYGASCGGRAVANCEIYFLNERADRAEGGTAG